MGILGTFLRLNPFIVRGLACSKFEARRESLMARVNAKAFTLYGLFAKSVETRRRQSYVRFISIPGQESPMVRLWLGRRFACFSGRCCAPRPSYPPQLLIPRLHSPPPHESLDPLSSAPTPP